MSSIISLRLFVVCGVSLVFSAHVRGQYQDKSFSPDAPDCYGYGCWVGFLQYSPEYMGPNAMPVPDAVGGAVEEFSKFETRLEGHRASGDKTDDVYFRLNYVIIPQRVSVECYTVVAEKYEMNNARRAKVQAWHGPGKGFATGDIHLSTTFQVIRDKKFPDIACRFGFRTTSGDHLADARFTDAPAYYFDASFGKTIIIPVIQRLSIRPYLSSGFLSWQTNTFKHMQNDAILGNGGVHMSFKKYSINAELAGYYGYENNGDRPLLFRSEFNYSSQRIIYNLGLKKGLHNNDFTTFYLGLAWRFNIGYFSNKEDYNRTTDDNYLTSTMNEDK